MALTPYNGNQKPRRTNDPTERSLDWIDRESAVARAQLEAKLAQNADIQGATAALGAQTAEYSARALESIADTQRSLAHDDDLYETQRKFLKDHMIPTMQQLFDKNLREGGEDFTSTRRSFSPPSEPTSPKKRFGGLL
jgi:hypothetical protein